MKRILSSLAFLLILTGCSDQQTSITGPGVDDEPADDARLAASAKLPPANNTLHVPLDYATIQEAVDAAAAGDRILVASGTYHETVMIVGAAKDRLQIVADADRGAVVLQGDHMGMDGECFFSSQPLCPEGRAGFYLEDVSGVIVRGFTITDFGMGAMSGMGESFLLFNAHHNRIEHNTMTASDMMGMTLLNSGHNVVEHNSAYLNDPDEPGRVGYGCGFHLQGAGTGHNVIRKNIAWGNPFAGIMIRAAGPDNVIADNVFRHGALWGVTNWLTDGTIIEKNRIVKHDGLQTPDKLPFPPEGYEFGVGIGLDLRLSDAVVVRENVIQNNLTWDIEWDGNGSNTFDRNICKTSSPGHLCGPGRGRTTPEGLTTAINSGIIMDSTPLF